MVESVKLAFQATVITMAFIFGLLYLISRIKQKKQCPICGKPCQGDFCCEAHELIYDDEEKFSREESMDADEEEALLEQGELERGERNMKAGIF